jgi:class 3 adenylate cyclase
MQTPETATRGPHLSVQQTVALLAVVLSLNSLFAALGSLVWEHLPYWPAFMVFALVCAYHRSLGILVAVLTPIISSLLGIGGGPLALYVFVNLLQALLVVLAFRRLDINPTLAGGKEKAKYLSFAVIGPSLVGSCTAWTYRHFFLANANDPPLHEYALWWTAENTVPAILPGLWLHKVVGELYNLRPWQGAPRRRKSYMGRTFQYAIPWMLTLVIVGVLVVFIVLRRMGGVGAPGGPWQRVHEAVGEYPLFPFLVVSLSISILYSLGCSLRYAREAWALEETVRRHSPTREVAERILTGESSPAARQIVTVLFSDIRGFTEKSNKFPPDELVNWLNAYFDRMCEICGRGGGSIDKFIGDGLMVVFGMHGPGSGAKDAIRCSVQMLKALKGLNAEYARRHYPEVQIGIGAHTGPVISGEIGSRDRRQYTVIGSTVNIAARMEQKTKDLPADTLPILLSAEVVREAGLLLDNDFEKAFLQINAELRGVAGPQVLYAVKDGALVEEMLGRAQSRSGNAPPPAGAT